MCQARRQRLTCSRTTIKKRVLKLFGKIIMGIRYMSSFGKFCHEVSILDLLFYVGDDAPYYIWGWREND